ncbi:putative anion transporter 4, chloroplastic [Drosera capensis]
MRGGGGEERRGGGEGCEGVCCGVSDIGEGEGGDDVGVGIGALQCGSGRHVGRHRTVVGESRLEHLLRRWFLQGERARAVGIAMAGFQLGSAVGLVLSPILMSKAGVFGPFVIFGLSGFLWVLVWLSATSSSPDRSPQISKYELNYIVGKKQKTQLSFDVQNKPKPQVIPPFKSLLSKAPTWSLMVANAMHSWGFFVILSWMLIYFKSIYHVDLRQAAWFSAVPWSMMALVGYFAGAWSDMLIQRGITINNSDSQNNAGTMHCCVAALCWLFSSMHILLKGQSQRVSESQSIGFVGPGIALICLTTARSPVVASAWLTLAVGLKFFSHSGFLVNIQEFASEYTGVLHGLSNTAGTLAAIVGTIGAGYFVELVGSFSGFLWLTSLLYFLAAIYWNIFSTGNRVNFEE